MRRILGLSVVIWSLAIVLLPAGATAKPVKSKLVLIAFGLIEPNGNFEYDFGMAVGTSKKAKRCRSGRKVSVFRDEPDGPDTLIGSRRTDNILQVAVVRWRNPDPETIAGNYYAEVKEEVKRKGPGTLKCLADRSNRITLRRPGFAPEPPVGVEQRRPTDKFKVVG